MRRVAFLLVASLVIALAAVPAHAANENLAPTTLVTGVSTQLAGPHGIAIDSAGFIYTANQSAVGERIYVHAGSANGDAAPVREFYATTGGGSTPLGIGIDANDHVWVTYNNGIVNEFPAGATGAVAPLRTIDTTPYMSMYGGGTRGITFDSHGNIYVSSHDNEKIVVYGSAASGSATALHVITGASTELSNQMGLAMTPDDALLVTCKDRVLRFAYGADGNVTPAGSIRWTGFSTHEGPNGVALDQSGRVYVTDRAASKVAIFPSTALASASDSDTPERVIVGSATGLDTPIGIAVQPSTGAFVVANAGSSSVAVFGTLSNASGSLGGGSGGGGSGGGGSGGGGSGGGGSGNTGGAAASGGTTTAPANTAASARPRGPVGISIDAGADYTNDPDVRLAIVWPAGATTVTVSNDGGFQNAQSFPVAPRIAWTLRSSGAERLPKNVYVRFSGGGVDDTKTFSDDIILDQSAPVISSASVAYLGGFGILSPRALLGVFRVRVTAEDSLSGVSRIRLKMGPEGIVSRRYRGTLLVASPPLAIKVRDRAGNWSAWRRL